MAKVVAEAQRTVNAEQAVREFKRFIAQATLESALIADVQLINKGILQIVVDTSWHCQPGVVHLKAAQHFQELWAAAYSPGEPHRARIRLITQNGMPLGGSRMWDGTLVYLANYLADDLIECAGDPSAEVLISS